MNETEYQNPGYVLGEDGQDIRRATRKQYSAEEKIRIVLDGLRGEQSIAEQMLENRLLKKRMIADGKDIE